MLSFAQDHAPLTVEGMFFQHNFAADKHTVLHSRGVGPSAVLEWAGCEKVRSAGITAEYRAPLQIVPANHLLPGWSVACVDHRLSIPGCLDRDENRSSAEAVEFSRSKDTMSELKRHIYCQSTR